MARGVRTCMAAVLAVLAVMVQGGGHRGNRAGSTTTSTSVRGSDRMVSGHRNRGNRQRNRNRRHVSKPPPLVVGHVGLAGHADVRLPPTGAIDITTLVKNGSKDVSAALDALAAANPQGRTVLFPGPGTYNLGTPPPHIPHTAHRTSHTHTAYHPHHPAHTRTHTHTHACVFEFMLKALPTH